MLSLSADVERVITDRHAAGHRARDLVSSGEHVVVRHPVGLPGQVEAGRDRFPPGVGIGIFRPGELLRLHPGHAETELLERPDDLDLDIRDIELESRPFPAGTGAA